MALRYLIGTGDVSDPTKWDGGVSVPGTVDDCYANGFTGTISANFTVNSLNTTESGAAAAGGGFTCASAVTITCAGGFRAGSTTCLTISALATAIGDSYGSMTTVGRIGLLIAGFGVQQGNSYGGAQSTAYGTSLTTGAVQYGNATAGSVGFSYGSLLASCSMLVGDSFGGSATNAHGASIGGGAAHVGDSHGGSGAATHGTFLSGGGTHYGRCYGGSAANAYGTLVNTGSICIPTLIVDSTGKGLTLANDGFVILQGVTTAAQVNVTASAGRYLIERGTSILRPFIRPPIYPAFAS